MGVVRASDGHSHIQFIVFSGVNNRGTKSAVVCAHAYNTIVRHHFERPLIENDATFYGPTYRSLHRLHICHLDKLKWLHRVVSIKHKRVHMQRVGIVD